MTSDAPFFLAKVECPVCKTVNEFETIKVGAYSENGRDTDFCPSDITWRNKKYQSYNPLLYFTATCENCLYSREFTKEFKDWKNDAYFKTYRQKTIKDLHLNLLSKPESVLRIIGGKLDAKQYPNETAILKLLLTIIDEKLNEGSSDLDLGRFYLRIAWLFRSMGQGDNPHHQAIKSHIFDVDKKIANMKASLAKVNEDLYSVDRAITSEFDDSKIANELKSLLMPVRDKYDAELKSFNESLKQLIAQSEAIQKIGEEHKSMALGDDTDDTSAASFHDYNSFADFLTEVAEKNADVVVDEHQAMSKAVEHYIKAFREGKDIAQGNQQIQASYLIAELSRRIGDYEQAKEYFNTTIRTGQEMIYRYKNDRSRTALARKILELAIEQAREGRTEAEVR